MTHSIQILGLMSGTSLDGLDMALCSFTKNKGYKIIKATTIDYQDDLKKKLRNAHLMSATELCMLDTSLGNYFGKCAADFLSRNKLKADYIASHGHTILHQPQNGFTLQIGKGANIAIVSGVPVICDFRSTDVACGGQGAPLVPIGDELLFHDFTHCLNLGGIANISFRKNKKRLAFDISPCNMALNFLAEKKGKPFDKDGKIAASGKVNVTLLKKLNALDYYSKPAPKSLGKEWFEKYFLPLIANEKNIEDTMRTVCEHIAVQISACIDQKKSRVLITGGGTKNKLLIQLLTAKTEAELIIPEPELIDFKEALIFAFLGYRRLMFVPNALSTVTGARRDSTGGAIYLP